MRVASIVAGVITVVSVIACQQPAPTVRWASNLSPAARDTLSQWLFCIDCPATSDVRTAAASLGDRAVPGLSHLLVDTPVEWRANLAARYGRMAQRINRTQDSARIVATYLANFEASAQHRSALLLGDIGTPLADSVLRVAIDSAQVRQYRREVVRALHEALLSSTMPRYDGTLSSYRAVFLDTIRVRRGSIAWTGNESVAIRGGPFPDDLIVRRWGNDSLAFVAVGQTGRYPLEVTSIGAAGVSQWDTVLIRTFPAAPWVAPRDVPAAVLPLTVYQSLARITTPRDTLHSLRFRPTTDLPISATVEWGSGAITTRWEDCGDRDFPGVPSRVAGTVVSQSGVPLGASQVVLVGTTLGATTTALGAFVINGVPSGWQGDVRAQRIGYSPVVRPAREGRSGYWLVLAPPGPVPPAFSPQTNSGPSPNTSNLVIPGGACRLLSLIKTDSTAPSTIARLRLTSP